MVRSKLCILFRRLNFLVVCPASVKYEFVNGLEVFLFTLLTGRTNLTKCFKLSDKKLNVFLNVIYFIVLQLFLLL